MLIAVDQLPTKGGEEYLNIEAIIRVAPLDYIEGEKVYEGSTIYLEGGMVVESLTPADKVARMIMGLPEVE